MNYLTKWDQSDERRLVSAHSNIVGVFFVQMCLKIVNELRNEQAKAGMSKVRPDFYWLMGLDHKIHNKWPPALSKNYDFRILIGQTTL